MRPMSDFCTINIRAPLETGQNFSQQLLVPQMLEVTYYQKAAIEENMELFAQLGFELEPFGRNSYQIRAVPAFFGPGPAERVLSGGAGYASQPDR